MHSVTVIASIQIGVMIESRTTPITAPTPIPGQLTRPVPIVVLPAGYPRQLTNIQPNFNAFLNFQHVTKWCESVVLAEVIPDAMRRAFTQVRNGRPRPALIEVPVDVLREEWGDKPINYTPAPRLKSGPDPKDVSALAAALVAANRPVIYAGQGDIRTYAFRVSNMGTLTPKDMDGVVTAFEEAIAELR